MSRQVRMSAPHGQLLRELYLITGKQVFEDYAERFAGYLAHPPEGVK